MPLDVLAWIQETHDMRDLDFTPKPKPGDHHVVLTRLSNAGSGLLWRGMPAMDPCRPYW